jgi:hypothetical protein
MADMPAIGKTDKNAAQGWHFRGIEAITAQLQPLLAKHGVVIVPASTITTTGQAVGMKDGWTDTTLVIDWCIYGPGGVTDMVTARTVGIGRDNSDKGANKAATAAWKYLLLHLFAIGDRADDSDGHDYDDARTVRTPSPAEVVFDMCRTADPATKGRLKALAESTGRKLTVAALTAEPEWLLVVGAELKEGTHHV